MELKEFKKTKAYAQLRAWVDEYVEPEKRAYELGLLVKRVLANYDEDFHNGQGRELLIEVAFLWSTSPEGGDFWACIGRRLPVENLRPCPVGGKRVREIVKAKKVPAPPKRVGWWFVLG